MWIEFAFIFTIGIIILLFIVCPAVGWYVCGIVDSYIGKSNGYGRYAVIGFALLSSIGLVVFAVNMILLFSGMPALFWF